MPPTEMETPETDETGGPRTDGGLASWFAIWHPRYRSILVQLMVAAALASGLIYAENSLLGLLTRSLAAPADGLPEVLANVAGSLALGVPFLVLTLLVLARVASAATGFWRQCTTGRLTIRTKDDLESEILAHLLRKDDAFFSRHSPAETVNRLAIDLYRVSDRRPNWMSVVWSGLLIVGSLTFFLLKDWRLALVGMLGCFAGALWTKWMTRPVKGMDAEYLEQDDRVKSRFEDFLRAAPEVQVGRLFGRIRRRFGDVQAPRSRLYLRYVRLSAVLGIGNMASALLAFVAMIAVILYLRRTGSGDRALALVPVVIWALPGLFGNAAMLVFLHLGFQLARTSMDRLLEYEASAPAPGVLSPTTAADDAAPRAEPIEFEGVTFRYAGPDGTQQGGVADVDTTFAPGHWTALVGGAGSGKSTLLKLLLGRLDPQAGGVRYGDAPLSAVPETTAARLFALMPQSPALLDATILENVLLGRPDRGDGPAAGTLSNADMDVVERSGLGKVCRLKALDMIPGPPEEYSGLAGQIAEIRRRVRQRLHEDCGITVRPYEAGQADPRHWVLECLTGGRCDRGQVASTLLGRAARGELRALSDTVTGAELAEFARGVLRETRHLLGLPNFQAYARLTPFPLDERIWRIRSSNVDLAERDPRTLKERVALCTIALTAAPEELADEARSRRWLNPPAQATTAADMERLRGPLGHACRPFDAAEVHPYLTWRENLVFGVVPVGNSRTARLSDQALLEFVGGDGLKDAFTRLGLAFGIGRLGGNLSGGQGQLVALCRALLRRTPVLVLDEPTSALDPASRTAVADLLGDWKADRIVVIVSHDPGLVEAADEIRLMDGGRLVGSGTFEELQQRSEVFRRTLERT